MPGKNLTREEARERAALLSVERTTCARLGRRSDLDRPGAGAPSARTTVARSAAREPGAATFVDLVAPAVARCSSTGASSTRRPCSTGPDRAGRPRRSDNELVVDAALRLQPHRRGPAPLRRPGRRRGLPLHAVRARRRPPGVRELRAARPQGAVHLHGDRARRAGTVVSNAAPRPAAGEPAATARPLAASRRRRRSPRTSPPWSPARTTCVRDELTTRLRDGTRWTSRWACCCRGSLAEHFDADEIFDGHQAGPGLLPRALRLPVPVRQVRPGLRARVQPRRDGEPGLRHIPRGLRLPLAR